MPGTYCAVTVCSNSATSAKKSGKHIAFYRFPKEESICKVWIHRCRRDDKFNFRNARVCSDHFKESDFERDLEAELLNLPTKKKLKPTALPSLKLNYDAVAEVTPTKVRERRLRVQRRSDKAFVKRLYEESRECSATDVLETVETSNIPEETSLLISSTVSMSTAEHENLLAKIELLSKENEHLKRELDLKQQTIEGGNLKQRELTENLKKLQAKFKFENKCRIQIENSMKKLLTKPQREMLMGTKKKVIWGSEDIAKAFTIRYL